MSYDLQVIARRRLTSGRLRQVVEASTPSADGGVRLELDGPLRMATDDLPDAALGAFRSAGWLTQLSVKRAGAVQGDGASLADWPLELAIELARASDGVVYDPQADRVTWPKGWHPRSRQSPREEVIDEMQLAFVRLGDGTDEELPRQLLSVVGRQFREALPRRYGGYEPLQHRFEGDRAGEEFVARWLEEAVGPAPAFFWTAAARPAFDGWTSLPGRPARPVRLPCSRIVLSFDGRPFLRHPEQAERLVGLFRALARDLDCLYAGAWLTRGVILRGNPAWRGGGEWTPMSLLPEWAGLPPGPSWLGWFGGPYAELLRPLFDNAATGSERDGLFVRLGREPLNYDDLAKAFPPLPQRLLARRTGRKARWVAGVPQVGLQPANEPAEDIPL